MAEETTLQGLTALRDRLAALPPPIVVINKSHSGASLVAELLEAMGVHMGTRFSGERDSLDLLPPLRHLVTRYHPDYGPLWEERAPCDRELLDLVHHAFDAHLEGYRPAGGRRWGWKLSQTTHILPVVDFLFPQARVIHLVRDGRDVAFRMQRPPEDPFWRKIGFNTDRVERWLGLEMTTRGHANNPHLYNALVWANCVAIARTAGQMLRGRYLEVRYEDLCRDFRPTAQRLLAHAGLEPRPSALEVFALHVRTDAVGRHRQYPPKKVAEVLQIIKPLLLSLGYLEEDG